MSYPIRTLVRGLAFSVAILSCPAALAADYYVDALAGDDATGSGSQVSPWRSITHALTQIADPPTGQTHAVHAAPGVYGAVTGEVFPLNLRPGLQLIGDGGASQTWIDGGGADLALVRMYSDQAGEGLRFTRDTQVVGLTLQGARYGVQLLSDWLPVSPTLSDLGVHGTEAAIAVHVFGTGQGEGSAEPLVQNVQLSENGVGLWAQNLGGYTLICSVVESAISRNDNVGVQADSAPGSCRVILTGTHVEANGSDGIQTRYTNGGLVWIEAMGCSISGNGRAGYRGRLDLGLGGASVAEFDRCTLAYNGGAGVIAIESAPGATHPTDITNCIVYGNNPDVQAGPAGSLPVDVRYSDIGTGAYNDLGGNLSVDPRHWAPEIMDYHLKAVSPCIDTGDPTSAPDPDGSIADMGAFPFDDQYAPTPITYCSSAPNSVGSGAFISTSGSPSLAAGDFTLTAAGCPPYKSGLFFYGPTRIEVPFGDGLRCVGAGGGGTYRLYPVQRSDAVGVMTRTIDFTSPPAGSGAGAILPGSNWNFQLWYRDPLVPGGSGFNLSDATSAWFLP